MVAYERCLATFCCRNDSMNDEVPIALPPDTFHHHGIPQCQYLGKWYVLLPHTGASQGALFWNCWESIRVLSSGGGGGGGEASTPKSLASTPKTFQLQYKLIWSRPYFECQSLP